MYGIGNLVKLQCGVTAKKFCRVELGLNEKVLVMG